MINNYSYDNPVPYSDLTFSNDAKRYNYTEIYGKGFTEVDKTTGNKQTINKGSANNIFNITMGQGYHFKLIIDQLMVNNSFNHEVKGYTYKNGNKKYETRGYGKFLPIKNISYKPISIESTKIPVGIFADFPIIHRRRVGSIQITLLDDVNCNYEKAVYTWFGTCTPSSTGFVAPMMEIISKAQYIEFNNQGKECKKYSFEVIPDGDVTLGRDYENNNLKEITFSVLIVSDIEGEVNENNLYKSSGRLEINEIEPEDDKIEVYYICADDKATGEIYTDKDKALRRAKQLTWSSNNFNTINPNEEPHVKYSIMPVRIPQQEYNTYANNAGGTRILNKSFDSTGKQTLSPLRQNDDRQ